MHAQDERLASGRIPPCWRILEPGSSYDGPDHPLVLADGPGFGLGSHATTQLCLQAIAALAPRDRPWTLLDFGAGSGILSIAAARLGGRAHAVEIEAPARESARRNAELNGVDLAVTAELPDGRFDLVVANILRPVLVAFAGELAARLAPGGTLVLSGLVSTDVPELGVVYAGVMGGDRREATQEHRRPERYARGDWNALVWKT